MKCRPAVGAAIEPRSRGVDGLIPLAILGAIGALDVRRQRHVADALDGLGHRAAGGSPTAGPCGGRETAAPGSRRCKRPRRRALEHDARARLQLLARGAPARPIPPRRGSPVDRIGRRPSAGTPPPRRSARAGRAAAPETPRVSFRTSRSPARRNSAMRLNDSVRRRRRSRGRAPAGGWRRAAPAPARSASRGSSKSKSATFTCRRRRTCRGWCGLLRRRSGFHRSPSLSHARSRTLSSRKSSIAAPSSTSSHVSGVDTVAFGCGAHRVDAGQRLPPRVLAVVHQHAASSAASDLRYSTVISFGLRDGQLGGQRLGERQHVAPAAARARSARRRAARASRWSSRTASCPTSSSASRTMSAAFAHLLECGAFARVQIEVQVVGPVDVVAARVPLVEIDAPEVDAPTAATARRRSPGSSRPCRRRDRSGRCGSTPAAAPAPPS